MNPFSCPSWTSLWSSSTSGSAISTVSMGPRLSPCLDGGSTYTRESRSLSSRLPSGGLEYTTALPHLPRLSSRTVEKPSRGTDRPDRLAPAVRHRRLGERGKLVAEAAEERAQRRPDGAVAAVFDLERDTGPVRRGGAQERLGSALRDPPGEGLHQHGVGRAFAADDPGVGAHRIGDASPAVQRPEARERMRHPFERQREGDDPAAVDRRRDLALVDLGCGGDLREHRLLTRVVGEAVAARVPLLRPAEREEPGVLPGAVVTDPLRRISFGPTLELVLLRRRLREERAHGAELLRVGDVRGAGDGDLAVVDVRPRPDDRQRLNRLRRRAEVVDEPAVAGLRDDSSVTDGHGMDDVPGFRDRPACDGYRDPIGHGERRLSARIPGDGGV